MGETQTVNNKKKVKKDERLKKKVAENNFYSVHRATIKVYKQKRLFKNPEKSVLNRGKNQLFPHYMKQVTEYLLKIKSSLTGNNIFSIVLTPKCNFRHFKITSWFNYLKEYLIIL